MVVETSTKRSVEPVTLGAPRPVCGGRIGQLERSGRRRGGRFRDRWTKPQTRQVTAGLASPCSRQSAVVSVSARHRSTEPIPSGQPSRSMPLRCCSATAISGLPTGDHVLASCAPRWTSCTGTRVSGATRATGDVGEIETLPSGSLRVRVYDRIDPVTRKRRHLTEIIPPGPGAAKEAEKARACRRRSMSSATRAPARPSTPCSTGTWRCSVSRTRRSTATRVCAQPHPTLIGDVPLGRINDDRRAPR